MRSWRKKKVICTACLLSVMFLLAGCSGGEDKAEGGVTEEHAAEKADDITRSAGRAEVIESAGEAKELLKEGNERFVEGLFAKKDLSEARRRYLAGGQKPFAVIVSCADSRVPPEMLFDQALGDLFVIRVAGNVIDDIAKASVEYAVEHLETHLVVVLGHQKCGAVTAAVENQAGGLPGSLDSIVMKIKPSVERAKLTGESGEGLVEAAAAENIKESLAALEQSPIIKEKLEKDELTLVGGKYHLESGEVEWYDGTE